MIISNFTKPEIDYLLTMCNFTEQEKILFIMHSKGKSLDSISDKLHILRDWAGKLSQKVNKKIIKIL